MHMNEELNQSLAPTKITSPTCPWDRWLISPSLRPLTGVSEWKRGVSEKKVLRALPDKFAVDTDTDSFLRGGIKDFSVSNFSEVIR